MVRRTLGSATALRIRPYSGSGMLGSIFFHLISTNGTDPVDTRVYGHPVEHSVTESASNLDHPLA